MTYDRLLFMLRAVGALTMALACCSCASRPLQGVIIPTNAATEGTSRVSILVATTRERSSGNIGEMFNGERSSTMSYARVDVSIPPDNVRKIGEVQWPVSPPGDRHSDFVPVSAEY